MIIKNELSKDEISICNLNRDRNAILRLEVDRFDDPMNGTLLNYLVNKYGVELFFVVDLDGNGNLDAYLFAGMESDYTLQIISVAIHKKYEGLGWGNKLMQILFSKGREAKFRKIELHVEKTNDRAVSLYTKFGFKEVGTAPNYYGSKRDAFVMSADI